MEEYRAQSLGACTLKLAQGPLAAMELLKGLPENVLARDSLKRVALRNEPRGLEPSRWNDVRWDKLEMVLISREYIIDSFSYYKAHAGLVIGKLSATPLDLCNSGDSDRAAQWCVIARRRRTPSLIRL